MKISEQVLLEKEFPFHIYDKDGKVVKTEKVRMRELSSAEVISLRKACTVHKQDGRKELDDERLGIKVGARMIVDADFEEEGGVKWKDMDGRQREGFLSALSSNYSVQLGNMMRELAPELTEEEENLSEPR